MTDERTLLASYIERLLKGDKEIVANLTLIINRYLQRFGGYRLCDPENIKSDVLSALMQNLRRGDFEGINLKQFNAYVRSIVLNNVLRANDVEKRLEYLPDFDSIESPCDSEEFQFANHDLVRFVLDKLGPECRELLTMKYLEDLDNSEIADKLKLRQVTVRVRIFRCTECARQVLKSHGIL